MRIILTMYILFSDNCFFAFAQHGTKIACPFTISPKIEQCSNGSLCVWHFKYTKHHEDGSTTKHVSWCFHSKEQAEQAKIKEDKFCKELHHMKDTLWGFYCQKSFQGVYCYACPSTKNSKDPIKQKELHEKIDKLQSRVRSVYDNIKNIKHFLNHSTKKNSMDNMGKIFMEYIQQLEKIRSQVDELKGNINHWFDKNTELKTLLNRVSNNLNSVQSQMDQTYSGWFNNNQNSLPDRGNNQHTTISNNSATPDQLRSNPPHQNNEQRTPSNTSKESSSFPSATLHDNNTGITTQGRNGTHGSFRDGDSNQAVTNQSKSDNGSAPQNQDTSWPSDSEGNWDESNGNNSSDLNLNIGQRNRKKIKGYAKVPFRKNSNDNRYRFKERSRDQGRKKGRDRIDSKRMRNRSLTQGRKKSRQNRKKVKISRPKKRKRR